MKANSLWKSIRLANLFGFVTVNKTGYVWHKYQQQQKKHKAIFLLSLS